MIYLTILIFLWILVGAYWLLRAFENKGSIINESPFSRIFYLAVMTLSFYLLFSKSFLAKFGFDNSLYISLPFYYLGFIIAVAGLAFAVYSRYFLGKNWSGRIEIKKGHTLLTTGPYGITRNPIYTGLLFGILGTALMYNQLKDILALVLVFCAFLIKIRKEEKFLSKKFPKYESYMKKVKRLIPYIY